MRFHLILIAVRIIIGGIVFLMAHSKSWGQERRPDSLTLKDIISEVLANNPLIDQVSGRVDQSEARIGKTKSGLYPQVFAQGSYMYLNEISTIELPLGEQISAMEIFQQSNWDIHLTAQYTLLDFGRTNTAVNIGTVQHKIAREDKKVIQNKLALSSTSIFYSILFTGQAIKVQEEQLESLERDLVRTKSLIQNESATNFDLLTTQVRISNSQNQMINLERQLKNQKITLNQLMGRNESVPLHIKGDFDIEPLYQDEKILLETALKQREEFTIAREQETLAGLQQQLATKSHLPVLNVGLTGGFKNGYLPDLGETRNNYTGFALFQVPLFQGFKTNHEVQEAKIREAIASSHTSEVRDQIYAEISESASNLKSSFERLENTQLLVAQAREAVEQARKRYENELITNLDLLDAELAVSQSQLALLEAKLRCVLNTYQLRWAIGEELY